jgi:hypothetical protein
MTIQQFSQGMKHPAQGQQVEEVCQYCGQSHPGVCPHIHEIEYYPGGQVKRVKFCKPVPGLQQPTYFEETPR